ncbi:3508_t:CDS:2, partial [Ambispora leptoticha]
QITKLKKEKIVLGEELKKEMKEDNLFWRRRKDYWTKEKDILEKEKENMKKKSEKEEIEEEDSMEGVVEIEADSFMTIRDSSEDDEEERSKNKGERKVVEEKEEILDLDFDDEDWVDWPVFNLGDDRMEGSNKEYNGSRIHY